MKTIINYLTIIFLTGALWQCTPQNAAEETHGHDEHGAGHSDEHGDEEGNEHGDEHVGEEGEAMVILSDVQIASAGITTGTFDTMNVSGSVNANGVFDLPPDNIAAVNAPMAGIVRKANYLVGSYVKKGAELVVMEHPEFIKLQEEYLAVLSSLGYLEAEYKRQQTLDSANIAARKALQRAESEYRTARARKLSLEKQLDYIGLDPANVADGQMTSNISVKAPISGYISQLNVHKGEFVQSEQEMYELINTDHMHLELNVYENDIAGVKKGQSILFSVPSLGGERYQGEVFLVGKSFDMETKTVKVHGHFNDMKPQFRRGLYVEAAIFTGDERVTALPEDAVVRDEGKTYIFTREGHQEDHQGEGIPFRRVEVATGIRRNGMVRILRTNGLPADADIVVEGAYDIFAEMKKGEGGHGHAH